MMIRDDPVIIDDNCVSVSVNLELLIVRVSYIISIQDHSILLYNVIYNSVHGHYIIHLSIYC